MSAPSPLRLFGSELREGDVIELWFQPHHNRIDHLFPYVGPYADNILRGARIASFAVGNLPMTIEAGALFSVHSRR